MKQGHSPIRAAPLPIELEAGAIPSAPRPWLRPDGDSIHIRGDTVAFRHSAQSARVAPGSDVLRPFLALVGKPPSAVAAFVRRFGVLSVNPTTGRPHILIVLARAGQTGEASELLRWYRDYAALLDATLRLADKHYWNRPHEPQDEQCVIDHFQRDHDQQRIVRAQDLHEFGSEGAPYGAWPPFPHWQVHQVLAQARAAGVRGTPELRDTLIRAVVNWWMIVGRVHPFVVCRVPRADVQPGQFGPYELTWPSGLWAALGSALVDQLRRATGAPPCAACGKPVIYSSGRRGIGRKHAWHTDPQHPECRKAKWRFDTQNKRASDRVKARRR